jgi:hypothetical protein
MRWPPPSRFAVLALVLCLSAPAGPAEPQGGPTSAANAANLRVAAQLGRQALTSLEAPDGKARLPQTPAATCGATQRRDQPGLGA